VYSVSARLTSASCSRDNECVQRNSNGHACFHPNPNTRSTTPCTSPAIGSILASHIDAGRSSSRTPSIAYYNILDGHALGGADFVISPRVSANNESDTVLCTTGIISSSRFLTLCRYALSDNDFAVSALSNVAACRAVHGFDARVVNEECCGPPRSICPTTPLLQESNRGVVMACAVVAALGALALRRLIQKLQAKRRLAAAHYRTELLGESRKT